MGKAILLAIGLGLGSGCTADAGPGRKIANVQWDTVWQTSRTFMDSVLPAPGLMTFNRGRLFVFDGTMAHLVAIDAESGAPLWTVGRLGKGPEEFAGVAALFRDRASGVGVVDIQNRRITRVTALGQVSGRVPLTSGQQPNQVCAFGDNRFVAADVFQLSLLVVDSTGALIKRLSPLWPDLAGTTSNDSRQVGLWNDEAGSRCLVTLFSGRGFALLSPGQEPVVGRYVETFDAFGMGERKDEREIQFWATGDAEFVADTALILFAGRTIDRGRLIDRFNGASGRYLDSYRLPFKTTEFAAGNGLMFVLDSSETQILALRARR